MSHITVHISLTAQDYNGAQYMDIMWGASGIAAVAHSAGTFNWAAGSMVQYAKLARSGISAGQSIGKMIGALTTDHVKISDLSAGCKVRLV